MTDSSDSSSNETSKGRLPIAEESHEVLGDVLGLVAHDLRNPLAALSSNVGFLGMVGDGLSDDAREAIDDLQLSIEAMGNSVELVCHDLKAQEPPPPLALNIGSAVRGFQAQAERAAKSHGVGLEVDLCGLDQDKFIASDHAFRRALTALVHNALTVAPPRSTVHLSLRRDDDRIVFRVEDDGVALSPALAEAALSAGGQVEVKTDPAGRYSRGLGLYVVARSAELAGVKLRIAETESGSAIELVAPAAV